MRRRTLLSIAGAGAIGSLAGCLSALSSGDATTPRIATRISTPSTDGAPTTFDPELGSPLVVGSGDTVRVLVVNGGYEQHAFHTHGHRFTVVEKDGNPIPEAARYQEDVGGIAPAERVTLEFEADAKPGIYPVHCHKVDHVTTDGAYPGGMATAIVYEDAMETDEFVEVMDDAGYEP